MWSSLRARGSGPGHESSLQPAAGQQSPAECSHLLSASTVSAQHCTAASFASMHSGFRRLLCLKAWQLTHLWPSQLEHMTWPSQSTRVTIHQCSLSGRGIQHMCTHTPPTSQHSTPHRTAAHRVASRHITSRRLALRRITQHHITSRCVASSHHVFTSHHIT